MIKSIYNALLDSLFPPRCPLCGADTARQGAWCPRCYRQVVSYRRLPLKARQFAALDAVWALCHYQIGVKKLIHELKYQRRFTHLAQLQFILDNELTNGDFAKYDAFVPVPLHQHRLSERGFNQTNKIFQPWVTRQGFSWSECLERQNDTVPQYSLSAAQRQRNTAKSFRLKQNVRLQGCRILLLDDIFTTGSTLYHCALILRQAGAIQVNGLVLASDAG